MNDDLRMDANDRIDQNNKRPRRKLRRYLVLIVLLGFAGLAFYAFSQGQQMGINQVTPIIKADTEPFKVRPDQPGGLDIPHQDKLVYDQLEGHGIESKVERLVPAPEKPMQSMGDEPEQSSPAGTSQASIAVAMDQDEAEPEKLTPLPQKEVSEKTVPDVKPADNADKKPAPAVPAKTETAKKPDVAIAAPKPDTSKPPVPKTDSANNKPAPKAEPGIAKTAAPAAVAPPIVPTVNPPAPSPVKKEAGGFKIQLAAFPDEATANKKAADWNKSYAAILSGRNLSVVKADIPQKGVFYRIQLLGLSDRDSAKSLCDQFKAKSQGCMVVK